VVYIEKNICDNLSENLLNLEGKSKDNLKAQKDLQAMPIRPYLHSILLPNAKYHMPPARYNLSTNDKTS